MSALRIEQDERVLQERGIPRCYWLYLCYNNHGDGLGMWTEDRRWVMNEIEAYPISGLDFCAVDGRDKKAWLHYVRNSWKGHGCVKNGGGVWTEQDSEQQWRNWLDKARLVEQLGRAKL